MKEPFQPSLVSRTVWPWQESSKTEERRLSSLSHQLIPLIAALTISGLFYYIDHAKMAVFVTGMALFIFFCSRHWPWGHTLMEKFFRRLSLYTGQIVTWLLLLPFFYICFSSGRVIQKISRRDPMHRNFARSAKSYWHKRQNAPAAEHYKRQF